MLHSLATALLVPPVSFLLLCVAGILLAPWRRRLGLGLARAGLVGLVALSLPVTAKGLIVSLEIDLPLIPSAAVPPGAIVILGGDAVREAGGDGGAAAELGPLSLERVRTAARLWHRSNLPILVTGGVVAPGTEPVAELMARALRQDYGVPVTWVENSAVDTWDNATRSAAILRQEGIGAAWLVTQPWHMRRALRSFRRFDIALTAAPTQLDRWTVQSVADFLPRASSWQISYYAFHEWIGCAWYALRG